MKRGMLWFGLALLWVAIGGEVLAQENYPQRPITGIVNFPQASMSELCARAMSDMFPKYVGQPLIVVCKPGSAGLIAGAALANSKPDGYTVGILTNVAASPDFLAKMRPASYSSKDIMPVANMSGFLITLCCNSDAPYKTYDEFIQYAKKNPGKIKFGSNGPGTPYWMLGQALAKENGLEFKDVPFSGEPEFRTALLGNHIDLALLTYGGVSREEIRAKSLRALCTYEYNRLEELPDVPTLKELGIHFAYTPLFIGIFVPRGTPQGIIDKLSEGMRKMSVDPQFKEKMNNLYMPIKYMDTKTFKEEVKKDAESSINFMREKGLL